ncbi:hypothetical protein QVD17_24746 [Tagetes erecta]|uniref:Uncharacterized protein n=1 Tax=Tagetes erecta TaxID=13708 RepID=A0AAD8KID3_TARER|nr:hypothetical protein QVD17_24746 [Tagetes erecta]
MMMMKTMMSGDNDENHQYQIRLFQRQWQEYLRSSNLRRPFTPWELSYAAKIFTGVNLQRFLRRHVTFHHRILPPTNHRLAGVNVKTVTGTSVDCKLLNKLLDSCCS